MSTKILVTSEVASWLVDAVNKTYNVSKAINNINLVTVNSVPYAQYSFSGTTIILDDAPTTWLVNVTYDYDVNYDYLDNSGWIVGEIMTGESNWTNKVFTSFYPISFIDEVRVNGIAVVGYSILGNGILLATAPTTSQTVEIDYFRKDLIIVDGNRDLYYTKKEVRDLVYAEIAQDDTSVQYPKSLVDTAISDWVSELITHMPDKSRFASFSIDSVGTINISPIVNSISTMDIVTTKPIPPSGRLLDRTTWNNIDYTSISSSNVMTVKTLSNIVTESSIYYIGYKLPRNIKRVTSVSYNWNATQDSGWINDYLFSNWLYYISNWYIYLKYSATYVIEVELNEYINYSDDNSLIYVDREDIWVVVFYALRQLYTWRENDKLANTSQLYMDKLKSYKRRMIKKRSNNKWNLMKTSSGLIPWNRFNMTRIPDTILVPQIIIKPSDSIDGWYSNN